MSFSSRKTAPNNVNLDESQTLQNKTLDGSTVIQSGADIQTPAIIDPTRADVKKDTLANLQTYASTAANGQLVYATDSKKMFQVLDGALAEVGGGSAGINYITNPDAEVNADGWSNYANTVAGELPDDFGGTVSGSWDNIAASSASPLRGSKSFVFGGINSGSGDLQGHGVYSSFTVDSADLAKKMTISFDYKLDDSALTNAVDGMLKVFIYDEDKSQLIRVNGEDIQLNANAGTHYAQFQTDATSTNYRLVIHNALALNIGEDFNIKIDNVQVGPTKITNGTIVSDWQDFTPSISGHGSAGWSALQGKYRRVGDSVELNIRAIAQSNGSGSDILTFGLPSGLSGDVTKIRGSVGVGREYDMGNGSSVWNVFDVTYNGASDGLIFQQDGTGGAYTGSMVRTTSQIYFRATVPIQGWSSNAKMSEDLGGREVVSNYTGIGVLSAAASPATIKFQTSEKDTTSSYDSVTGIYTVPETGYYDIKAATQLTFTGTTQVINLTKNGSILKYGTIEDSAGRLYLNVQGEYLEKGDELEIRGSIWSGTGTFSSVVESDSLRHYMSITKRSSPQTILETETVAARYSTNAGLALTANTFTDIVYGDLNHDTHNAYNTSTGEYTIPASGIYSINAKYILNAATTGEEYIRMLVNGVEESLIFANHPSSNEQVHMILSDNFKLEKGDVVKIQARTSSSSRSLITANSFNTFAIARIK